MSNSNGNGNTAVIKHIKKRDGRLVEFDISRIERAVRSAMEASKEGDIVADPVRIARNVNRDLLSNGYSDHSPDGAPIPTIEQIQNLVERELVREDFPKTVRGYITYRDERSRLRSLNINIPEDVRAAVDESSKFFRNPLSEFVYMTKYARWNDDKGRREVWPETVKRYADFMRKNLGSRLEERDAERVEHAILGQKIVPSMRLLWSAGKAAERANAAAYNCAYIAPTDLKDFGDISYVLMCGTGVGFSVENHVIQQLPIVQRQKGSKLPAHVIGDSKEAWADALVKGLRTWYGGEDIEFSYDKIRPAGSKLHTMGGTSSGPEALRQLLDYSRTTILSKQGRRLDSLSVHDIICKIGEIVVSGGVRRSALISLSDLDDVRMRDAKSGTWYLDNNQRAMANNSAVYLNRPSQREFLDEWMALIRSNSGERGIFNRGGLPTQMPARRMPWFQDRLHDSGVNPCGEIYLPSRGFCNLTEVVARHDSTLRGLLEQVELATIAGTYQATLTNFDYISPKWKENAEQERLLGVSITGMMDCPLLRNPEVLRMLRDHAVEVNKVYAAKFGINPAAAVTCVKPSGNTSQMVDSSSGIHGREFEFYKRHARISANDPIFHMMRDQKYPYFPEVGQNGYSATTFVVPFAVASPPGAVIKKNLSALDQLEEWRKVKSNYTEHNPSTTIGVGEDEWIPTANWVWRNWDQVGGLSFLPKSDHVYRLAPYEEISRAQYEELNSRLPKIDYAQLLRYEKEDRTGGAKELACTGGACAL